jgi:SAM-dependent methyltransferase
MTTTTTHAEVDSGRVTTARELERRWSAQQTAYVRHRAERFATIARVVAAVCADVPNPRVLDLAGGTGSLAEAVLAELPRAQVVIVDKDPVLTAIAEDQVPERPGSTVACLDLDDPAWVSDGRVAGKPYDAVVSSTALHWLQPGVLARVYWQLADLVRPGGIVLNGDHLLYDEITQPTLHGVAARDDERVQAAAFDAGVDTWDDWWAAVEAVPHYEEALARRAEAWGDSLHTPPPKVTAGFHLEALRSAGFRETGTVWRYLDDVVLCAVR